MISSHNGHTFDGWEDDDSVGNGMIEWVVSMWESKEGEEEEMEMEERLIGGDEDR